VSCFARCPMPPRELRRWTHLSDSLSVPSYSPCPSAVAPPRRSNLWAGVARTIPLARIMPPNTVERGRCIRIDWMQETV